MCEGDDIGARDAGAGSGDERDDRDGWDGDRGDPGDRGGRATGAQRPGGGREATGVRRTMREANDG